MEPILKNIAKEIEADRYNGGWTKTVTGIDKSKSDGYSIKGSFIREGMAALYPGLYLDCNIGGSRKNQTKNYTLIELTPEGAVNILTTERGTSGCNRNFLDGRDWAIRLWPTIDAWFAARDAAPNALIDASAAPATAEECAARIDAAEIEYGRQFACLQAPELLGIIRAAEQRLRKIVPQE